MFARHLYSQFALSSYKGRELAIVCDRKRADRSAKACAANERTNIFYCLLAILSVILLPEHALADRAEELLGVRDIQPVTREVIDESLGENAFKAMMKKVRDGKQSPSDAAARMVKDAHHDVSSLLEDMGMNVEAADIRAAMDSFVEAHFTASSSSHLKRPKVAIDDVQVQPKTSLPNVKSVHELVSEAVNTSAKVPLASPKADIANALAKVNTPSLQTPSLKNTDATASTPSLAKVTRPDVVLHLHNTLNPTTAQLKNNDVGSNLPDISAHATPHVNDIMANIPAVTVNSTHLDHITPDINKDLANNVDRQAIEQAVNTDAITQQVRQAVNSNTIAQQLNPSVHLDNLSKQVTQGIKLGDVSQQVKQSVNVGDITQRVTQAVNTDNITQQVMQAVNVDDIKKQVDVDPSQKLSNLKKDVQQKVKAGVNIDKIKRSVQQSVNLDHVKVDVATKLNVSLNKARDDIKAATQTAFGKVNDYMTKQINDANTDYTKKKNAYNAIKIPPVRKERYCKSHHLGHCWKHGHRETAASAKARAKAKAKKSTAKGLRDGAKKKLDKLHAGDDKLKARESNVMANIDTVFNGATTSIVNADGSDGTAINQTDSSGSTTQHNAARKRQHSNANYAHNDSKVIEITGSLRENIDSEASIAAAIGVNSTAIVAVGDIGENADVTINGNVNERLSTPASIAASIGVNTDALIEIGNIGNERDTRIEGGLTETIKTPGVISAAIGYNAGSNVKIGNANSIINGSLDRSIQADEILVASIGANSIAEANIGNISGDIHGNAEQHIAIDSAIAASIGGNTKAKIDIGNISKKATIGSLKQHITQDGSLIAAAIGYDTDAIISIGNINARVHGDVDQNISVGSITNATIGAHTQSIARIADVNAEVGGNLKQNISTGNILNVPLGIDTHAITDIGVIDARVGGNVDQTISTGSISALTIGINTASEVRVGNVYAPVNGNLDSTIHTGSIGAYAMGLSIGGDKDLAARVDIGNVHSPVNDSINMNISTGDIYSLDFGLILDLGVFGTLDLSTSECRGSVSGTVSIGNVGSPC